MAKMEIGASRRSACMDALSFVSVMQLALRHER